MRPKLPLAALKDLEIHKVFLRFFALPSAIWARESEYFGYDANGVGSYILDAGDYYFACGNGAHGGSEANIALALANLGVDSTFFTVVPNNSLGKSAVRAMRSNDVHCTPVVLSTPEETPSHRLGTYYLETGYGIRASKVTYDRKHSAITEWE